MKHTPGPWIFIEGGPLEGDTVITTQDRMNGDIIPIVDMDTDYEGEIGIEQEANAKLILAAPELLEALRKAEFRLAKLIALNDEEPGIASPDDAVALEAVRGAIAKAEGRSWETARAAIDAATR